MKLPDLTSDIPGIGGRLKSRPEDFVVEELPLYPPSGEGTHVFMTVEKRGASTAAAADMIARALGRRRHDVGFAGQKDVHAVARQTLSIEHVDPDQAARLNLPGIRVLGVARHGHKLRLGHLAGNRFDLRVRGLAVDPRAALGLAQAATAVLQRRGAPNYFGPQRFGAAGNNGLIGRAALLGRYQEAVDGIVGADSDRDRPDVREARRLCRAGDYHAAAPAWPRSFQSEARICRTLARGGDPRVAWLSVDQKMRKFYLNAFQSELFNEVLAERIDRIDRLEDGDVAWLHAGGACFLVQDVRREQPRCEAFEISPTGPQFGAGMLQPAGATAAAERRVLEANRLCTPDFQTPDGMYAHGARRPLRVPVRFDEVSIGTDEYGSFLRLRFDLPAGAFATSVMREIMKG
ncbi:MAG: tRNA pseudouridine(13) synthase TruD [Phycisphaerales bacterium]|nr:MAG: tRNA pseudouridine(13) synthase TruD [Phycisphaerales bacterium]